MENAVAHLLQAALGGEWEIRRPEQGWSEESYIAARGTRRVFVKFGTAPRILPRLSALGVAPALLREGESEGVAYAIQEFIEGTYPTHRWVVEHDGDVARLLQKIQQDASLRRLLAAADRPVRQLRDIELSHQRVKASLGNRRSFQAGCEWLIGRRPVLSEDALVPTHGDISPKNFLITSRGLLMVDWDDIALADPMRDLGPLLWWYFPPARWPSFLQRCGMALTPALNARIYWWAACISLDVTAGVLERGYYAEAQGFLADFLAAASEQPNPRPLYTRLPG